MALESPIHSIGWLLAAADLSAKQYYLVYLTSSGINLSTAGGIALGVLQNDPVSGAACDVGDSGVTKVVYGNTVLLGDSLMSDSSGRAVPLTGSNVCVGIALEAGSVGQIGTMFLTNKTGSASTNNWSMLSIPVTLATIADGTIVNSFTPGFAGTVQKIFFINTTAATTAAKGSTLNVDIGSTPPTGGSLVLTSANQTPLGNVVNASAVTALNSFLATDTLKVVAASTTTFVEGAGLLVIVLKGG